ncbi:MAG: hypothetical protein JXR96_25690 [Deltaproteobacteria bacterium]|nr:hypothetical protein [Deltaproteobacteria bacterium]
MYDSLSCASLDACGLFDMPMDFDDIAFMQLIMNLNDSDQALAAKMRSMRELQKEKKALTDELAELNDCMRESEENDDLLEDWVIVPSDDDRNEGDVHIDKMGRLMCKEEEIVSSHASELDSDTLLGLAKIGAAWAEEELNARGIYRKSDIEARVEDLQREIEDLNNASDLMVMDLNRLLNKRNEAVQLVSNIMYKSHQTAQALIANFK